jgi:signal transduction histidine kinase
MSVPPPPLLSITGFEAIVIATLALLYAAIRRRTAEPGMVCLSIGFALAAIWYGLCDRIVYTGPTLETPTQRIGGVGIALSVVLITIGVVQYLGTPRGRLRPLVYACWASALTATAVVALTPWMPLRVFHVSVLVAYLGAAAVAFRRASQRPGEGHLLLALALLSLPVTPFLMLALGVHSTQLKYIAGVSVAIFGLLLLTVSLLRRQRWLGVEVQRRSEAEAQLREANTRLEARVQERTAHLHELIGGLEAFNRSVSHDLRGPLGGMSTLARMAADALARGDAAIAQRALPLIATQCDASAEMVASMLELARLSDAPVQREAVCLSELARSAFDEVMLGQPGRAPPALFVGEMPLVTADRRLLRPVFVNLLANATKFTRGSDAPRIDVEAQVQGRDVTVSVRDNGVGFNAEVAERLFEPFYRAHDKRYEGHGLGLSIVRRAIEAMGGRVWAQALPQRGAAMRFELPGALVAVRDAWSETVREATTLDTRAAA